MPSLPPFSLGKRKKLMKHTGINLRLTDKGVRFSHTSQDGLFKNLKKWVGNSIFKPIWNGLEWHLLPLHDKRFDEFAHVIGEKTLDELYLDESVVGKKFLQGEIAAYDGDEASDEEEDAEL